jgi:hypothetical protein
MKIKPFGHHSISKKDLALKICFPFSLVKGRFSLPRILLHFAVLKKTCTFAAVK